MNDRRVGLLDNYDIEVLRTWKGRGAILCEATQGETQGRTPRVMILKEYTGPRDKILFQDALLTHVREQGFLNVEQIVRSKEGELLVQDQEGTQYILKTYLEGAECNVRDMDECKQAVAVLAALHKASDIKNNPTLMDGKSTFQIDKEFEKHNKELRKVRKFLKEKGQKTDFEIYLMKSFDYFLDFALQVTEEFKKYLNDRSVSDSHIVCHGDYQYHNILFAGGGIHLINFEKCILDNPVRDLYLFMRKLLEKSNWSDEVGDTLLLSYGKEREMNEHEHIQLYYRLFYPEKFWKIVNFYYNSGKAWIPGRNMEKLEKLMDQERDKRTFLENYRTKYGLF